jgi:hypothetical protein
MHLASNDRVPLSANCASRMEYGLYKEVCMLSTQPTSPGLADFVERYQVCWEVWPEYLMVEGKRRRWQRHQIRQMSAPVQAKS